MIFEILNLVKNRTHWLQSQKKDISFWSSFQAAKKEKRKLLFSNCQKSKSVKKIIR